MSPLRRSERLAKKKKAEQSNLHRLGPTSHATSKAARVLKRTPKPQSRKHAVPSVSEITKSPKLSKTIDSMASTTPAFDGEIVPWQTPMTPMPSDWLMVDNTPPGRKERLQSVKYLVNQRASLRSGKVSRSICFLDLPWDIRNEIYDYFAEVPEQGYFFPLSEIEAAPSRYYEGLVYTDSPEEGDVAENYEDYSVDTTLSENDGDPKQQKKHARFVKVAEKEKLSKTADAVPILITRKSLLSVCRQIQQEWAPKFFKGTTIVVNSLKRNNANSPSIPILDRDKPRYNATEFGTLYLPTLQTLTISNIRRITYNTTTGKHPSRVDWKQFNHFTSLISKYRAVLRSLEVVTLEHTPCGCVGYKLRMIHVFGPLRRSRLRGDSWEVCIGTRENKRWVNLRNALCGSHPTAILGNWNTERNIYINRKALLQVVGLALILRKADLSHLTEPSGTVNVYASDHASYAGHAGDDDNTLDDDCIENGGYSSEGEDEDEDDSDSAMRDDSQEPGDMGGERDEDNASD